MRSPVRSADPLSGGDGQRPGCLIGGPEETVSQELQGIFETHSAGQEDCQTDPERMTGNARMNIRVTGRRPGCGKGCNSGLNDI